SPTSAITSPSCTSKSTSVSACTDPYDFVIPRSSRSGFSLTVTRRFLPQKRVEAPYGASTALTNLLAVLRVRPGADLAPLQPAVPEEAGVVRLGDRDHRVLDRRLLPRAVLAEPIDARDLLVPEQRDGGCRGTVRLEGHVLVDGHRLPPRDDVLHALRRRILA